MYSDRVLLNSPGFKILQLFSFLTPIVSFCQLAAPSLFWFYPFFHSSVGTQRHYSSANVDPVVTCQHFLLRPAWSTLSCLTLMDNRSSLCAQHAIWCAVLTDRGTEGQFARADFRNVQRGKTFIKSSLPFFLSACHIISTVLSGPQGSPSHLVSRVSMSRLHGGIKEE